jgi:ferredoxin--NADP+ reductase
MRPNPGKTNFERIANGATDFMAINTSALFPEPNLNAVPASEPITGTIVSNDSCIRGKSASFVRHTEIDISGTALENNFFVGQAFGVITPGLDCQGKPHKVRLYSLACPSAGEDGAGKIISTTTKRVIDEHRAQKPGDDTDNHSLFLGVCSNYLCDLSPGDKVQVSGPNGKRFLLPLDKAQHNYLFVATGTGVAPFRGMIKELLESSSTATSCQIHLVMGAPYTTDLLYDDLFARLSSEHENFHYHTAISREERRDGSPGLYVHHLLDERINNFTSLLSDPKTLVYICGLAGMQCGLFQTMARHGVSDGYFSMKDQLANIDPDDWDLRTVRRSVRCAERCMVEVY